MAIEGKDDGTVARRLRLGMVGGGRGAFIGAVHRLAAAVPTDGLVLALTGTPVIIGNEVVATSMLGIARLSLATGQELEYRTWRELGIDTTVDPLLAAALVPDDVALQGNLAPLALDAGSVALEDGTHALLAAMQGRAFIFNLGHGIVPQTPPAHVAALVARVRAV